MMDAAIVSSSHYLASLTADQAPPSLREMLRESCRIPTRRLDRFIHLALIGSARCVGNRALNSGCGVYLGSGLGPLGSTIRCQEQMFRDRLLPKPFNFVNTLGSCAGFYVADNLGISGPNMFVSRRGRSLRAALTLAFTDFAAGATRAALVGVVEEAPVPLADQRRRLGVGADVALAEGSHWLLLANRTPLEGERRIRFVPGTETVRKAAAESSSRRELPFHDSRDAAWLVGEVNEKRAGALQLAGEEGLFDVSPVLSRESEKRLY